MKKLLVSLTLLAQISSYCLAQKNVIPVKSLEIVNKYLHIIFVENNHGQGLSDLLKNDFVFDDPFGKSRGAADFIAYAQRWISLKKSITMEKQFVDGKAVCSLYLIEVPTATGDKAIFHLADYVELEDGKMTREQVFFDDQIKFAKAMGYLDEYLKKYN